MKSMFKIAKICVFVFFLHFILECSGESKRLLLTDQDLINGRFEQLEKTLREQQALITSLSQRLQVKEEYGSTYVRWGKSSCRTEADLVYSGYMTGQIYYTNSAQFGGPANNLCLPNNPELSNKTVKGNSYLYGTEFEETNFGADAVQEDVPCALCHRRNSTTSVMIPGRKTCYSGWTMEYNGRLASNAYIHRASSYVCVDMNPDYIVGGEANNNNNLLYATGAKCGSLPCPPYHDNLELYCVVCTK